jgi:hypothetical protein
MTFEEKEKLTTFLAGLLPLFLLCCMPTNQEKKLRCDIQRRTSDLSDDVVNKV